MGRYLAILILCVCTAPFLPGLIENHLGAFKGEQIEAAESTSGSGKRTFRITMDRNGHFIADARLNDRPVEMLVDTGATTAAIPLSIAKEIGIDVDPADFRHEVRTANGTTYGAGVEIDSLRIGNIHLKHIDAIVLNDQSLGQPLLGMSVLHELERFDISNGTLVLVQ